MFLKRHQRGLSRPQTVEEGTRVSPAVWPPSEAGSYQTFIFLVLFVTFFFFFVPSLYFSRNVPLCAPDPHIHEVAQTSWEFRRAAILTQPPECWDYTWTQLEDLILHMCLPQSTQPSSHIIMESNFARVLKRKENMTQSQRLYDEK